MSINKVILKGRLGKDPENNNGCVKFSLATDEGYKDKEGNKVDKTAWHQVVAFGKLGEILQKYLHKGDEAVIIGKLDYREHEGKYYTSIIANEFDFVSSKKDGSTNNSRPSTDYEPAPPLVEQDDNVPF